MRWLLSPYRERGTYAALLYLLLGLPMGILDFVVVVTGLSLGLGLFVTILGIPVLVATLLVARVLATLERRLAWTLVEARLPSPTLGRDDAPGMFWARLRALVASRRTWAELGFLLLRLPLGILDFAVAASILGLMLQGFAQPIVVAAGVDTNIGSWTVDTIGESLIFLPVSLLFLLIGPRLIQGWGAVSGRIATAFLGRVETSELKAEIARVLARTGEVDAYRILDELEMRLGRGPFLTPLRLEAALLALESNGRIRVRRDRPRALYALA